MLAETELRAIGAASQLLKTRTTEPAIHHASQTEGRHGGGNFPGPLVAAPTICLWLSGLRVKQGMRPLLDHEARPCLVCGEAVLEVGR